MQISKATNAHAPQNGQKRLLSLDVMRGLIMILLAAESCLLYVALSAATPPLISQNVINQFFHHPWHGLYFWDLVQPAFMTMAGAALYISYYYKAQKGVTWSQNFKHIALRCVKLFLFGVALHCVYAGRLVWELWNVLTQLSITTMIAYLIIRKSNIFRRTDFLLTTSVARQPGPLLYPGPSQVLVTARY